MMEKNKKLQKKLEEILPESIKDEGSKKENRMESWSAAIKISNFYF
jgi:hypothetical protein